MSDETSKDTPQEPTSEFYVVETKKAKEPASGSPLIPDGAAPPEGKDYKQWQDSGFVRPVMLPEDLIHTYRKSAEIPKNARARGQNTSGYGWVLDPVVKFDDPALEEKAGLWIYMDRLAKWQREVISAVQEKKDATEIPEPDRPTESEIKAEIAAWKEQAVMEKAFLEVRLETLCIENPIQELIRRTEVNKSATSYCGWEMIRNPIGVPIRAKLIEGLFMRATPLGDQQWVPTLRKVSPVSYEEVQVQTRFRRYAIEVNGKKVWYKAFGDPSTVSQQTGKIYEDEETFEAAKGKNKGEPKDAKIATEMILWAEYSPGAEPYGMVIWHGHSLDVQTARKAKEFDYEELADSKMPRGIFSFRDMDIESPVVDGFIKFLREGGNNRNRFAVLKMLTANLAKALSGGAGAGAFDFLDLSPAQKDEATHLKMKSDADEGVAGDFGNPGTYIGRTKEVQNRSVAETAQHVAEQQTYRTLRELWDHAINQKLVLPWGFRFWKFKLLAPKQQRLQEMGAFIKILVDAHIITPAEGRAIAAELLGKELDEPARWQKVPPKALQGGMLDELVPEEDPEDLLDEEEEETPRETESDTADVGTARSIMEALGALAGTFTDGPAKKLRERLGLSRLGKLPEHEELGPDLMPED